MSANSEHMEHRWGTRVQLDVPTELTTTDGLSALASVKNASVSGAFLETTATIPVLSRVSLFPFARAGECLDGCVVRVENAGIALEWLDPGSRSVPALLSLRHHVPAKGASHHESAAAI